MIACRLAAPKPGFTLIEVLIAISLLAVIVTLLFASLRIAGQSWQAGEQRIAEVNTKAVVYQFFKRHIAAIRPLPEMSEFGDDVVETGSMAFQGRPQNLGFVATLPSSAVRKGLQIFTIAADPARPDTLIVRLTPYQALTQDDAAPILPEVLLEGIANFRFAYFGKTEEVEAAAWRDEWLLADRLPQLIRVSIRLDDGSLWPDMIFPTRITTANDAIIVNDDSLPVDDDAQQR
ncbi:MAG: prepilin-type N-terminal cleavage/methylation domain-containing protein [Methylomonas sp.]|nr:prepilin-type N-terminal cleavage/methylation domain-containing protein [Methylomonas sp.]MBS3964765.1 prepilin-type N-terminal cleavage/methylation domain-containing protein [Methylomonas sp.]PPD22641.1 MAG: prepilin-type cleavage/methylation domain-containing protein [Methylomonas sp.]PPD27953.1 MAG: prepilin-type cleavage/methylation domain-containing protein [Methylomonas sp.]PPD40062.1 MAG: prepilin-type cleavage/methylation domain-containing protein [Methylomonas sp.]